MAAEREPQVKVEDVAPRGYAVDRAIVRQKKTGRPVKFELTEQTREAVNTYLRETRRTPGQWLILGRAGAESHLTTRQYSRLLGEWLASVGLDPSVYGTHSLRRTKATLIYKRTGNLRAVQLLLGHTKIESTVATWASRSTTPLKLRSKSTSDDTGWSGHALPSRRRGVRANKRHSEAQPRVGTVFRVGNRAEEPEVGISRSAIAPSHC